MFHFTGYRVFFPNFRCRLQKETMAYYNHQVTPFGNLRIIAYLPLPEAYRSLSRPSSPVSTKAFTVCPLKLDSMFEISHTDLISRGNRFPCFADLSIHLHQSQGLDFAVKIDVFGN